MIPFLGMMLLTLVVWVFMYSKRLAWVYRHRIAPEAIATPEKLHALLPEAVNNASNNLKNLFELPILFYGLVLYLIYAQLLDEVHIYCGYWFFVFRCVHSFIHCSRNHVSLRFMSYFLSALALWLMVIRTTVSLVTTEFSGL